MNQVSRTQTADDEADFRRKRKRAILSAWAGFAMDAYSIYIAVSTLLPALIYFQGDATAEQKSIFAGMTLAVTLLGRPLGALLFGHFADVLGRSRIGAITIFGFGVMSLLIGCLPGAELIGVVPAMTLLIAFRFIEGIFLGGEYTAATPMALEYAPPAHRGLIAALIQCAASGGLHSPYVQWGWRIPFLIGFVLSCAVAWYLRRNVEDSAVWKSVATRKTTSPLREMLKGRSGRAFVQAWVISNGVFFLASVGSSVQPQFLLHNNKGYTALDLAHTQLLAPIFAMCSYVLFGWLSDHIGRKPALYISGTLATLFTPVTVTLVGLGQMPGWGVLTALATLTQVLYVAPFGVLSAYMSERFATEVRSSGWGVAYSTAVIIPSFFPYYMVWLGQSMPFVYTAGVLLAFGGILIVVAAACGPETRGVDLRTVGLTHEKPKA